MEVEVWFVTNSKSKFILDFHVYCSKNEATPVGRACTRAEQALVHQAIIYLTTRLENTSHVVVMDI